MENKKNTMKMTAVLSVSMITILGSTAVSPALSGIKSAFPDMNDLWIQMVLIVPTVCIIPSCFLCKLAIEKWGQKQVVLMGITIYLIGGLGAGLMPNFYMLLLMRALLGVGCGFITPMAQALISSNFEGELRERLTAYSASASYLMGIIASYLVGKLVGINWRLCFTIYFVAAVVLILNIWYLPAPKIVNVVKKEAKQYPVNIRACGIIFCMALINLAFYTFSASISLFMRNENIGDETSSGIIVAGFMICGFFVGLIVTNIRKLIGRYTMALGCLMMAAGYAGLFRAEQMPVIFISAGLIGGSYSILYSGIFSGIRSVSRDQTENTKLITYTTAGMFTGQAVSQYVLRGMELLTGVSGYRFRFLVLATGLLIGTISIIVYQTITFSRKRV